MLLASLWLFLFDYLNDVLALLFVNSSAPVIYCVLTTTIYVVTVSIREILNALVG